jgi:hypothetical protein
MKVNAMHSKHLSLFHVGNEAVGLSEDLKDSTDGPKLLLDWID